MSEETTQGAAASEPPASGLRICALPEGLDLVSGRRLEHVEIEYETWGTLAPAKDNVLLLTTGLSPSSHARSNALNPEPGWWEDMIGPGRPLDTNRWFVICNNSFGSCYGSTGPASTDPRTGRPYRLTFPCLSIEDIATTSRLLLKSLGIHPVAAVVGSSMGGMTALAYGVLFPFEAERIMSISAGAHALPFAISMRSTQREAIRLDPDWKGGDYAPDQPPKNGMRIARKMGVTTYRSPGEWNERFGRKRIAPPPADPFATRFEIESYLDHQADKFVGRFDANALLYLTSAIDHFDLSEGHGSVAAALASSRGRFLLLTFTSDWLYPAEQLAKVAGELRQAGKRVTYRCIDSDRGHDAFLVEHEKQARVIGAFLEGIDE